MFPTLLAIGPIHISSFLVFIIFAWLVFSFLFWRELRNQAVTEEHIYNLMFYGTLAAFVGARLGFVLSHWQLFAGNLWIRIFTLWIEPGFSFYGGFLAGGAVMLMMSRMFSIRRSLFLDAFTTGFSSAFTWGAFAAFLEGSSIGKHTTGVFGISLPGQGSRVHPVALYEMGAVFFLLLLLYVVRRYRKQTLGKPGLTALWFFFFFSISMFGLEFLKESPVYFSRLTLNQWICIGIYGEAVGGLITWGGGKEWVKTYVPIMYKKVFQKVGGIYAKFSRRNTR
jgi:phosphatidylglycerol:prolipoprotein diacylglycerol transferase